MDQIDKFYQLSNLKAMVLVFFYHLTHLTLRQIRLRNSALLLLFLIFVLLCFFFFFFFLAKQLQL